LIPFKAMTEELLEEKYPTANLCIRLVQGLQDELGKTVPSLQTQVGRHLHGKLMEGILPRLYQYETCQTTRGATFFDPRMKKCGFRQESNFDDAQQQLQGELQQLLRDDLTKTKSESAPTKTHRNSKSPLC